MRDLRGIREANAMRATGDQLWLRPGDRVCRFQFEGTLGTWDLNTGKLLSSAKLTKEPPAKGPAGERLIDFDPSSNRAVVHNSNTMRFRVLDASDGHEIGTGPFSKDQMMRSTLSPGGKLIATGEMNLFELRDVATGATVLSARLTEDVWPAAAAFAPDSSFVAAVTTYPKAGKTAYLKVWDIVSGRERFARPLSASLPNSVRVSPDGRRIAAVTVDGGVKVWDADGKQLLAWRERGFAKDIAFSPTVDRLAVVIIDSGVAIHELAWGETVCSLKADADYVAFSADGKRLVAAQRGELVRMWDTPRDRPPTYTYTGHAVRMFALAFSPDSRHFALADQENVVTIRETASGKTIHKLRGHQGPLTFVSYRDDGQRLASGSEDGSMRIWDTKSGEALVVLEGHTGGGVRAAFSHDGKVATGSANGEVIVWSGEGHELHRWQAHAKETDGATKGVPVNGLAFSTDGTLLASAGEDCVVKVFDVQKNQEVQAIREHKTPVNPVAFSPDGSLLASASERAGGKLIIWDIRAAKVRHSIEKVSQGIDRDVCFRKDGKEVVLRDEIGWVHAWSVASGKRVLVGPELPTGFDIGHEAFTSPDGQLMVQFGTSQIQLRPTTRPLQTEQEFTADAQETLRWHAAHAQLAELTGQEFAARFHRGRER
jgi:WD40 repeat protein